MHRRRKLLKAGGAQEVVINFELLQLNYSQARAQHSEVHVFSSSGSSAVSSCTGTGWLVDGVDESNCVAAPKVSLLCFNFLVGGASAIVTTASVLCYTCEIIMWAWQTRKSWGGTGPQCPPPFLRLCNGHNHSIIYTLGMRLGSPM